MRSVLAALIVIGVVACSRSGRTDVVVSAASSLAGPFADIEAEFEADHPDIDVIVNLAGSPTLREQIIGGAPVDVFASADDENMQVVADAGRVAGGVEVFATNSMTIAVPAGNPAGVGGLVDLGRDGLLVGLCDPSVPCGALAVEILASAGVDPSADTLEPNVGSLVTKLDAGELDVGIVYVTDLRRGMRLDGIAIPDDVNATTPYPVAVIADGPNADAGVIFVEFLLSPRGAGIMQRHGFGAP